MNSMNKHNNGVHIRRKQCKCQNCDIEFSRLNHEITHVTTIHKQRSILEHYVIIKQQERLIFKEHKKSVYECMKYQCSNRWI